MGKESHYALFSAAENTDKKVKESVELNNLAIEIKRDYQKNKEWSESLIVKRKLLEEKITDIAYFDYSNNHPEDTQGLNINEQKIFLAEFKTLIKESENLEIRVQGKNEDYFSLLSDTDLLDGSAYRILPKDYLDRYDRNSMLMSRLTVNVKKEHFIGLSQALMKLYADDHNKKIMQSKIMGPKNLGRLTDQAVIYFSNANLQDAIEISRQLKELLPADSLVEHIPTGMYRIDKGISYSETLEGQSSSHGESRAEIISKAVTESLLTDISVDKCLENQLRVHGYDVENPALVAQSVRNAYIDTSLTESGREGLPSNDIESFKRDPVNFSQQYNINTKELNAILQIPPEGKVIFSKDSNAGYLVEFVDDSYGNEKQASIDSYFLDSKVRNKESKLVEYIDVPIFNPEKKFVFTGLLRGGSVIVTELNSDTYRIYCDSRSDASLLYDNVLMAVDERDYAIRKRNITKASVFMYFSEDKWKLVLQPQEQNPTLRAEDNIVKVQFPGDYIQSEKQKIFDSYRNKIHQELKKSAKKVNVIFNEPLINEDLLQTPTEQNTSVRTWLDVGEQVKIRLDEQINILKKYERNLNVELLKTIDADKIKTLNDMIETNKSIISFNKKQYSELLYELSKVEGSWLWQSIKNKKGMSGVIKINDYEVMTEINSSYAYNLTVNERFDNLVYLHKITRNLNFKSEFNFGIKNHSDINIPDFNISMTSQQLKKLYVTNEYTAKERGALYRVILDVKHMEYISHVLTQTGKISELFASLGCKNSRLIPQDFYLSLTRSDSSGRCYPLVRAMSVALAHEGQSGADVLIDKLYIAAANPDSHDAVLLQSSLKNLHSNVNAVESSFSHGVMGLKQMQMLLEIKTETTLFAMNSKNHSMLIGKTVSDGKTTYYFYDPNFGIFSFKNSKRLFSALKVFFTEKKMADYYSAFSRENKPAFELVFINTEEMANVPIGNHLSVNDLSMSEELSTKSLREKKVDELIYQQGEISHDTQLKTTLTILKAEQWGEEIEDAAIQLASEHQLDENWIPLFSSVEQIENNRYKLKYINIKNLDITRWVETSDRTFMRFQRYSMEQMGIFSRYYTFEDSEIRANLEQGNPMSVDGLNAGIAIQSIIQWVEEKNLTETEKRMKPSNLLLALKIHSYVNYSMMAYGTMNDLAKINQIIKVGLNRNESVIFGEINYFTSAFAKTANEGISVLFSGALVGFDIYELDHAEDDPQRIVFGTQLAFDFAGFASGLTGVGLGAMGSVGAATAVGGVSVIIAGLGIGFVGLARNFAIIGEDAKAVGRYFYALDQAYQGNGYEYISDKRAFMPKFGAVFSTIDLKNSQIEFDSQYIYRTTASSSGGGRKNYIFWAGNFPTMLKDRQQAINIRKGIGYQKATHQADFQDANIIILPVIPKSYIKYNYNLWPGCTSRNDSGFNVIRRLEKADNFDYDFYIFPSENTITQIYHEYVETSVSIILDEKMREIIVPQLANEWYGKIEYKIEGGGGEYKLILNDGISVFLTDDLSLNTHSKWIIDSSLLSNDLVEFKNNILTVGGIKIEIDNTTVKGQVLVVNEKNEISEIDFSSAKINIVSEDESLWDNSKESLESHLQHYTINQQSHGQYIIVNNHQYDGQNVGRAIYDVAKQRYIFIDTDDENKQNAILGGITDNEAYFFLPIQKTIWKVNIETGAIISEYQLNSQVQREFKILQLWKSDTHFYFSCQFSDTQEVAHFELGSNKVALMSINGQPSKLRELAQTPTKLTQDVQKSLLSTYLLNGHQKKDQQVYEVVSDIADMLTIYGVDHNQTEHRYWLRKKDSLLIKPNLFPSMAYGEASGESRLQQSHWPLPNDLVLIGNLFDKSGNEIFYFYSSKNKELYRQVGAGQNILNSMKPTAWYMNMPFLENVIFWQNNLYMVDKNGVICQIDAEGHYQVVGLNEKWFAENPMWWGKLQDYDCLRTIALVGIKNESNNQLIPAWYHRGKIIITANLLPENQIRFLGINTENTGALLFDSANKKLYQQQFITENTVSEVFGKNPSSLYYSLLPNAVELYPSLHFSGIKIVANGVLLFAESGEILYLNMLEEDAVSPPQMGSSLIIRGSKEGDTLAPSPIDKVKNLILSAGEGQDRYVISKEAWQYYQTIIIDNKSNDLLVDTLELPIENLAQLTITRHDDDLLIADREQNTVLILRQIFDAEKLTYRHLQICFAHQTNSLSVEQLIENHAVMVGEMPALQVDNYRGIENDIHMLLMSEQIAGLAPSDTLAIPRMDTQLLPSMGSHNNLLDTRSRG